MKNTILRNSKGQEIADLFVDEKSNRWRIVSKSEPTFKRTLATEKEAFDVWHRISVRRQENCGSNFVAFI